MTNDKPAPVSSDVRELAEFAVKQHGNLGTELVADRIQALLSQREAKDRETVARWMVENSLATGHGDTLEDLLKEATWQIKERLSQREAEWRNAIKEYLREIDSPVRDIALCQVRRQALRALASDSVKDKP
jgi:hypothetical protein